MPFNVHQFTFKFEDIIIVKTGNDPFLSFVVNGPMPVQERGAIAGVFKPNINAWMYNPSKKKKVNWQKALKKELQSFGVNEFPYFKEEHTDAMTSYGLILEAEFLIPRYMKDYKKSKDGACT